jgi:5-methyltetrahydropteroyltriglutamate--homocysteine methyltransferase
LRRCNNRSETRRPRGTAADRIITFAELVGQENVMAGTDGGLGSRVHSQLAWAKLRALRDGAAIASKRLWS